MKTLFKTGIFLVLLGFFSYYIGNLSYIFGMISGFLGVGFSVLTYVGASCSLMVNLGKLFTSFLIFMLVLKVYHYFKES